MPPILKYQYKQTTRMYVVTELSVILYHFRIGKYEENLGNVSVRKYFCYRFLED